MENGFVNFICWILLEGECLRYSRENFENVLGDITKYKEPSIQVNNWLSGFIED